MSVCPSVCVIVCVYVLSHYLHAPTTTTTTRVPGGECRQWDWTGGRGHPRDQCDRCERRANAQWRLPAAAPWRPRPARRRHVGRRLRGQPGPPRSWLWHTGSGGQEAEVCEANGGEWGFWVRLHREEPILRSCPFFPLPHSRRNLGNHVFGAWSEKLHDDFLPFTFCAGLQLNSLCLIALFLSSVYPTSFIHSFIHSSTLSFVAKASWWRSPAEIPSNGLNYFKSNWITDQ